LLRARAGHALVETRNNADEVALGLLTPNLMGIGGLRIHVGTVPIFGISSPKNLGLQLLSPSWSRFLCPVSRR
jgi:hypothetical protein